MTLSAYLGSKAAGVGQPAWSNVIGKRLNSGAVRL
jgi:hypothetical protein